MFHSFLMWFVFNVLTDCSLGHMGNVFGWILDATLYSSILIVCFAVMFGNSSGLGLGYWSVLILTSHNYFPTLTREVINICRDSPPSVSLSLFSAVDSCSSLGWQLWMALSGSRGGTNPPLGHLHYVCVFVCNM